MKNTIVISVVAIIVIIGSALFAKKYWESHQYIKITPQTGDITEAIYGLGKVKSDERHEVRVGVISTVKNLYIHEGDEVKKGQPLMKMDSGSVFTAPFSGTVTYLPVNEGENVFPQVILLRLENLKNRYIEVALDQEGALRIAKNQVARVSFESLRGSVLKGKVSALYPKEDELLVKIEVDQLGENILPGMSVDVSIEVGKVSGMLVPLKAVRNGVLSIERDGHLKKIKVEVGLIDGISAEIKGSELLPTDLVLVPKD